MIKIKEDVKEMSMLDLCHNQVFVRDRWAWYRDFDREISCLDLVRELLDPKESEDIIAMDDENLNEYLFYCLDDGTRESLVAMLYRALWSFADIRENYKEALKRINLEEWRRES